MEAEGSGMLAQLLISAFLGGAAGLFIRKVGGFVYMLFGLFAILILIGMMSVDSNSNAAAWNATGEVSGGVIAMIFKWFINAISIAPLITLGGSAGFYWGFSR